MKLYATVASERATKGQGGNKELFIDIKVGSANESRSIAWLKVKVEGTHYTFGWADIEKGGTALQILKQDRLDGKILVSSEVGGLEKAIQQIADKKQYNYLPVGHDGLYYRKEKEKGEKQKSEHGREHMRDNVQITHDENCPECRIANGSK